MNDGVAVESRRECDSSIAILIVIDPGLRVLCVRRDFQDLRVEAQLGLIDTAIVLDGVAKDPGQHLKRFVAEAVQHCAGLDTAFRERGQVKFVVHRCGSNHFVEGFLLFERFRHDPTSTVREGSKPVTSPG